MGLGGRLKEHGVMQQGKKARTWLWGCIKAMKSECSKFLLIKPFSHNLNSTTSLSLPPPSRQHPERRE